MNELKISHLRAMKKADLYDLCLKEFGNDTASVYQHYTKSEMIDDLMTLTVPTADDAATPSGTADNLSGDTP